MDKVQALRVQDMDGRFDPEARWWRCPACGADYVMERGVRPLHCPYCGVRGNSSELGELGKD